MEDLSLPIQKIGEKNWVDKLMAFLRKKNVDVKSLPDDTQIEKVKEKLGWTPPSEIIAYYRYFGAIEHPHFMPTLYALQDFTGLAGSGWEFIKKEFPADFTGQFVVFGTAPGGDPLCVSKETGEIYLFSHDPLLAEKVYNNFSDYLIGEIINFKENTLGEMQLENGEEKQDFLARLLPGTNISYHLRHTKLG
ncbi:MAG: SMI1/KNR4 family protein [Tannerellaceae bacterium]|nr:SMI1/KNR4 family protein [Tannerellaceae bacterium]